ncbi:hypothetical protein CMO93_05725, partial [Candidatus Woesearchaeota archaeon]|nr:hypothetical protein [Candidatus Woesearchaeota archaeon]
GENVFESYYVGEFELNHYPYFKCFTSERNEIEFGIEGKGDSAIILSKYVASLNLNPDEEVELVSTDDTIKLIFPIGTTATVDGNAISEISIEIIETPSEYSGVEMASDIHQFQPSGAKFNQPILLVRKYDPSAITECPESLILRQHNDDGSLKARINSKEIDCENHEVTFEIDGFSTVGLQGSQEEDLIPKMTSNTAPSGTVIFSTEGNLRLGGYTEEAWSAFDDSAVVGQSDQWQAAPVPTTSNPQWLGYEFPEAKIVTRYTVMGAVRDTASRSPGDWTFQGSNDGTNWDILDTQTGHSWDVLSQTKSFDITNTDAYNSYRIHITATAGGEDAVRIGQLEMIGTSVVSSSGSIGGNDANTILLLHMDGTDGSTTFTDSSSSAHPVTGNGNAHIETSQSKFGGASAYFDNIFDFLTIADSDDWNFGSEDFTIDFWVNFDAANADDWLIGQGAPIDWQKNIPELPIDLSWSIHQTNNNFLVFTYSDDSQIEYTCGTQFPSLSTNANIWYHAAFVRQGNNLYFYKDGVRVGTCPLSITSFRDSTEQIQIGATAHQLFTFFKGVRVFGSGNLDGYLDEIRISKDIARWTEDFTPPAREYDDQPICTETTWTPEPLTVAEGEGFTQTSNCGTNRQAIGTKEIGVTLISSTVISFKDMQFTPSVVEIQKGTTVTWVNDDMMAHTVTSKDGLFDSGILQPGQEFSFTFDTAGDFPYQCDIHPMSMQGSIVVTDSCTETVWTPFPSTIDEGVEFTQTSNCGTTREAVGIGGNIGGNDANTILLLHMNGTDGSTTFTDSSSLAHPIETEGNAHVETSQSKFGGSSVYFDGSGDYLFATGHTLSDYNFGTGDFTIDTWVRFDNIGRINTLAGRRASTGGGFWWLFFSPSKGLSFENRLSSGAYSGSFDQGNIDGWAADTWYHVALVKYGNNWNIYRDGVSVASSASGAIISDPNTGIDIGRIRYSPTGYGPMGYFDEFRVSKGVARWTSSFTPPAAEYGGQVPCTETVWTPYSSIVNEGDGFTQVSNCGTTRQAVGTKEAGVTSQPGDCTLTDAYWEKDDAVAGETVNLIVNGENCDGVELDFIVMEEDVLADDPVVTNPISSIFQDGIINTTWVAEYQDDFGDPEYYFIAQDVTSEIKSSNLVTVTDIGDFDISGTPPPIINGTPPIVVYGANTAADDFYRSENNILIDVETSESGFSSITYVLLNSSSDKIDDIPFTTFTTEYTFQDLEDGVYYYSVKVINQDGLPATTIPRKITLDTAVPIINLDSETEEDMILSIVSNVPTGLSVIEDNIREVNYSLYDVDDNLNLTKSFDFVPSSIDLTGLDDGTYTYIVKVIDKGGLTSVTDPRSFILDTTPPIISFSGGTAEDNSHQNSRDIPIFVEVLNDESVQNVTFYLYDSSEGLIDEASFPNLVNTHTFEGLDEGEYYYNVYVKDNASHTSTSDLRTITLDTTPPQISFDTGTEEDNAYKNQNYVFMRINALDEDFGTVIYSLFDSSQVNINTKSFTEIKKEFTFTELVEMQGEVVVTDSSSTDVSFKDMMFTPSVLEIEKGTTVTWVNDDMMAHTVTSKDGLFDSGILQPGQEFSFTFDTAGDFFYQCDLHPMSMQGSIVVTDIQPMSGVYYYSVVLADKAGNFGNTPTRKITLDTQSLMVNCAAGTNADGAYLDQNSIPISISLTAENDIVELSYQLFDSSFELINETSFTTLPADFEFVNLEDGTYFYKVDVEDNLGLEASTEPRKVTIDTTSPVINLDNIPDDLFLSDLSELNLGTHITEENIKNVTLNLYDGSLEPIGSVNFTTLSEDLSGLNLDGLSDGVYYFDVEIEDETGHVNTSVKKRFVLDTIEPIIGYSPITLENYSYHNKGSLTIGITLEEDNLQNIKFYLYDSSQNLVDKKESEEPVGEAIFMGLDDGYYSYYVLAVDSAGGEANTEPRGIIIDTTKPEISFQEEVADNSILTSQDEIKIGVSVVEENLEKVTYDLYDEGLNLVGQEGFSTAISELTPPVLEDGTYYYDVEAVDKAGNVETSGTKRFTLDTSPPQVKYNLATIKNDSYLNQDYIFIRLNITDENIDTVTYSLYDSELSLINETEFDTLVSEFTFTNLDDGTYYYDAAVKDKTGLTGSTERIEVTLDSTQPIIHYAYGTAVDGSYLNQSNISIHLDIEEENIDSVTYYLYDSNLNPINEARFNASVTEFTFTNLDDGTYYYNASVKDKSGQVNNTNTMNVVLDTSPPIVDLISKSPVDDSILTSDNLPIEVDVTEGNLKSIVFSLYNESLDLIEQSNLSSLDAEYVFTNLDPDVYYYDVEVKDKLNKTTTMPLKRVTKIPSTRFNGTSTDLSMVNSQAISLLTLEVAPDGKIVYNSVINLSGITDLNPIIKIEFNRVEVDAASFPNLNKPATLYIDDLNFGNPVILKDGDTCPEDVCELKNYSSGDIVFGVENFSVFTVKDTSLIIEEAVGTTSTSQQPTTVQEIVDRSQQETIIKETTRDVSTLQSSEEEVEEPEKGYGKIIAILFIILISVLLAGSYLYLRYSKKHGPLIESPKFKPIGDGRRTIDFNFKSPLGRKVLLYILTFSSKGYPKQTIKNQLLKAGWSDPLIEKVFRIVQEKQDKLYYLESPKFELKGRKIIDYDFKSHDGRRALLYIQTFRSKSYSKQAIKARLLKAGWPDNILEKAFKIVQERHDNIHHFESPKFKSAVSGKKIINYNFKSLAGKELVQYIHTFSLKGYSKSIIKSKLTKAGWPDNIVKEAFKKMKK